MDSGFWHSLGHGVGFEVHEPPSVSHGSQIPLLPGECSASNRPFTAVGSAAAASRTWC